MLIGLVGCTSNTANSGKSAQKVVIYTNADKEAVEAMQNSLNAAGYEGKYVLQTMGTSELGGKLMAKATKLRLI